MLRTLTIQEALASECGDTHALPVVFLCTFCCIYPYPTRRLPA